MVELVTKYQRYAEYKDSGVEWLGEIPKKWDVKKLVWYFSAEKGKNGQLLTKEYCGANSGKFPVYSGQTENNGIMGYIDTYEFDAGDQGVLFSTTVGAKAMSINYLKGKFSLSQNCMIIKNRTKDINTRFYYYHCQPLFALERGLIPEHMQASFRVEDLYSYRISLPTLIEQTQIANFLDHETAKIDSLIEKQKQLIQLLKEKRQAVISHAVTKGLDPSVKMKDSGVEWLGEVPEHWSVSRYKYCTSRVVVGIAEAATHAYSEIGVPIIRATNIKEYGLNVDQVLYLKESFANMNESKYLYTNDIITVRTGYPGISAVIPEQLNKSHCFTNLVSTPKPHHCSHFLNEYLNSIMGKAYFALLGWGSAQKNISVPILQEFPIAHPDLAEQIKIINFIEKEKIQFNALILKAQNSIQLMQERRTALISATVTGKIDVRNWQNPNDVKTELSA